MRNIDTIIIHCSATAPGMKVNVEVIRKWHLDRGFNDIGYHYVILPNGDIQLGRPVEKVGAHAKGHNTGSIGICVVGGVMKKDRKTPDCNFTAAQWAALHALTKSLKVEYGIKRVIGHRDVDDGKACPTFDVEAWDAA